MSRFRWWYPIPYEPPKGSLLDHIAPVRTASYATNPFRRVLYHDAPWGWRVAQLPDRCAYRLMPAWLAWCADFWASRYWYTFGPLIRLGILKGPEGGYFSEFRWWFWNAEREASWQWVKTGEWS